MSDFDRRQFLKSVLGQLVQTAGTVIVASAAVSLPRAQGNESQAAETPPEDILARADRLAAAGTSSVENEAGAFEFLNGGFRNTPLGGFRNRPLSSFRNHPFGGFANTPLGTFGNAPGGAFRNTPLSTFNNGGWPNGPWGGFNNGLLGSFHNGGWPNGGWRNW